MPLVRISVDESRTTAEIKSISDGVYTSLIEAAKAPVDDLFHIVTKHSSENLIFSKNYMNIERTSGFITVQIFFNAGRTIEQKKSIYKTIADKLHNNPGIRKEDIFISIVEVPKENWSFGNGIAQYAE